MAESANERWACVVCSYAYDPINGDPQRGIAPGTLFEELPDDWRCPWCGAGKATFVPEDDWQPNLEARG